VLAAMTQLSAMEVFKSEFGLIFISNAFVGKMFVLSA